MNWISPWKAAALLVCAAVALGLPPDASTPAQAAPPKAAAPPIDSLTDEVVYHIFMRSFRDSNGDGQGDLNGVTESIP
ncbi:hypothetical protein DBR41_30720, partial [Pseudomonas sp. HMWF010]